MPAQKYAAPVGIFSIGESSNNLFAIEVGASPEISVLSYNNESYSA